MAGTVQGIAHIWQVGDAPIGSGDAGEVYSAARLDKPEFVGVLKKPNKVATGGTIQRQARQIAQEAQALSLLNGLPDGKAHPPRLLDQAPEFTKGTANYFIISEIATGEALSTMLAEALKTGEPFPQRVIITVLDALFDLFSRAHKSGVLWNDVKLEHIYWDNEASSVGVIDWGNAIFIDHQEQSTHPRWQDYQQIVETLGIFLQTAAPFLFEELSWDEFTDKSLNASLVSSLARRISYQHEVITMRVMENQSLMRVVLNNPPSVSGLKEIKGYQQNLKEIGAPWSNNEVLQYGQKMVEKALRDGDIQSAIVATAQIFEIFGEDISFSWHLLREYFRDASIITLPSFSELALHTLNKRWNAVKSIASQINNQEYRSTILNAIEKASLLDEQNKRKQ